MKPLVIDVGEGTYLVDGENPIDRAKYVSGVFSKAMDYIEELNSPRNYLIDKLMLETINWYQSEMVRLNWPFS